MAPQHYTASLSQSQGRAGWSVIFRHPVRQDPATGRAGIRVRRGLSTRDPKEAERLRDELNQLLAEPRYHDPAARAEAGRRFDPRVVEIFYYKMVPEEVDFAEVRERAIPLPSSEDGDYRRVLLLGTTGAGKTTLVRQLIGTDPQKERFPSTSTAKTTIHDTEIVLDSGPWRAAITFVSSDEVREYLYECISVAVLAAWRNGNDDEILRRLLSHVNQRFRFNYVLGNGPTQGGSDFQDDDEFDDDLDDNQEMFTPEELGDIDLEATNKLLTSTVAGLRSIAKKHGTKLCSDLEASGETDERVLDELFEEELDNLLREDETYHQLADALIDEIEKRFDLLVTGEVSRTKQGWPLSWHWETEDRDQFLKAISRFSSNYAPLFGRLLTPLVSGVRVAGPFAPSWDDGRQPPLVLLDGEGLGHTPTSSAAISTTVSRRIEEADAVLLVDSAAQPMQAAPVAAMREVVSTGNAKKLILVFTHFDEVRGDNLPTPAIKAQHVLASAENVLAAFGEELGHYAERALRQRIESARFFLADVHEPLSGEGKSDKRTIKQLRKLLASIDGVIERPKPTESRPVYDRMNLVLAVKQAAENFHEGWFPRLGLEAKPGIVKEHWTRVKALARRLAMGWTDEYDTLRPVADLRRELQDRIFVFVQSPVAWEGPDPSEDEKQATYEALADSIGRRLLELATRRVWKERAREWQDAFDKHGRGSTFVRAHIIGEQIYNPAAPIPAVTPSPDRNEFLHEVAKEVDVAAEELGARLR